MEERRTRNGIFDLLDHLEQGLCADENALSTSPVFVKGIKYFIALSQSSWYSSSLAPQGLIFFRWIRVTQSRGSQESLSLQFTLPFAFCSLSIPRWQARELSMRSCCQSVCFLLLMDSQKPHVLAVRGDPLDGWCTVGPRCIN
ncbi:hypothetical protein AVEN_167682-1 [Araneus ventricosus]|uniref:Uncharacterized protein n=1 Tax=Araneus ventricosus TaxID=182803 RepID=A0A4Y2S4B1_ARAVE|nr:hypothetical protein AVEN_167682-1 [Araneus ventricosus]